jgi:outer membrane immunogenic protein
VTSGGTTTGFSGSRNYSGWTVGGGVEWAFMNNWSAKLEYLFIDFGDGPTLSATPALNIVSGRLTDNIVRAGVNYKF